MWSAKTTKATASPNVALSDDTAHGTILDDDSIINVTKREDRCWICESWIEGSFIVDLPNNVEGLEMLDDLEEGYNTFMHFEFDEWAPDLMEDMRARNQKGKQRNFRMMP